MIMKMRQPALRIRIIISRKEGTIMNENQPSWQTKSQKKGKVLRITATAEAVETETKSVDRWIRMRLLSVQLLLLKLKRNPSKREEDKGGNGTRTVAS
mmetsp:Transcript_1846/g.2772  ORF Transcript_1846/g.2772 Transcript_1846/m.2772 type:complete len:98 (-) Transcript_1846:1106-1399(-)